MPTAMPTALPTKTASSPAATQHRAATAEPATGGLELVFGALVVAVIAWLAFSGWRFYVDYVLPEARVVPTITPTPGPNMEALRQEARRLRQVIDYVGEGIAFRQARRPDLAEIDFRNALALDPGNLEARQNLREMGIEPPPAAVLNTPVPPTPTIFPTVTPRP